jgi:hypothetical protein
VVALLGGVGPTLNAVASAVLRERGIEVHPFHALDAEAIALGRSLLPRGYPAPSYALAGALVASVRAIRATRPECPVSFLTLSAHCGHRMADYAAALDAAQIEDVTVLAPAVVSLAEIAPAAGAGLPVRALLDAVIAADVLVHLGCETRALAASARAVDAWLAAAVPMVASAIVHGWLDDALGEIAEGLRGLHVRPARDAVRVRITGEFVPSISSGDIGARLIERIEALGARAQPPLVTEWLLYVLWQLGPRFATLRARVLSRFRRRARAAGCSLVTPDDPAVLADCVGALYSPDLRGSAGHLEAGTFDRVERYDLADLVVSVKAFASTASSSVSDAVLFAMARRARTGFLALETTGEGEAHIESRLELAIDLAHARRALRRGVSP